MAGLTITMTCFWRTARAAGPTATDVRVDPSSYTCGSANFINFEEFADAMDLSARTFPGIRFTTTDATDWVVGDFATGAYNGKYPNGQYTSEGTHWAWLGISQGRGRIDLARPARTFSLLTSAATDVQLEAYDSSDNLIAVAGPTASNVSTGLMDELRIDAGASIIDHLVVHDSSNFFLVDGICTDAAGASVRNDPRNVPPPFSTNSDFWTWPDADRDGLPDYWEQNGVWVNQKFLNLPAMGASAQHKDLFIWVDAVSASYASDSVRDFIRKAFDASPLDNPDGKRGVTVHFHVGKLDLDRATYGSAASESPADVYKVLEATASASGYVSDALAGDQSVPPIAKYVFFGENIPDASGEALGIPGSQAMVAVSDAQLDSISSLAWKTQRFWPGESRSFVRAVDATHEIGHLLGLRHHGNRGTPTKDTSYKSVMSYSYSLFGLPCSGFLCVANVDDYSRTGSTDPFSSPPDTNLDWRVGSEDGALKFVEGQFGLGADNYYLDWLPNHLRMNENPFEDEESVQQQATDASPDSITGLEKTFGAFAFAGFLAPVKNEPSTNSVKAGSAVPLKFSLGGDVGLGVLASGSPASIQVSCLTGTPISAAKPTSSAGRSPLSFDASTSTYKYVWKTESNWTGTCRRIVMTLGDASQHTALFRFGN